MNLLHPTIGHRVNLIAPSGKRAACSFAVRPKRRWVDMDDAPPILAPVDRSALSYSTKVLLVATVADYGSSQARKVTLRRRVPPETSNTVL